jgi:hypothetical protein
MSAANDLRRIAAKAQARYVEFKSRVIEETHRSIVDGSEITGSPGQPERTGKLKESWQTIVESPTSTLIASDDPAAPAVEGNWSDVAFHSGGPHSRDLTAAGFPRIVEAVASEVNR